MQPPRCSACVTRASIWALHPVKRSAGCILLTALSLNFAPHLPHRSAISHHRGQVFSPSMRMLPRGKEWGGAVFRLRSWCCQLCGAKELRHYVPYLTLLQTGPDISFHRRYKHWGWGVQAHWSVTSLWFTQYIFLCVCLFPLPLLLNCSIFILSMWRRPTWGWLED